MNLIYIPLDISPKMPHNEIGELEACVAEMGAELSEMDAELSRKDAEIAR